jgi:predicted phage terminase large subunit-like protein
VEQSLELLTRTVFTNNYIPHMPTAKQAVFLSLPMREALFGGSAGGGKSEALLMAALQYVDVPGYAALLLRRTYADLALPGALMDRAYEWLAGTDARWDEKTKTWTFPSGATLTFGYLEYEKTKYRYQGSEFQFVGYDELTQFAEPMYTYLFSRLRRLEGSTVPLRMRAASNPGGEGHEWVYERFLALRSLDRQFVPANLNDNPHLDHDEYVLSLSELDPITRDQLLKGLWVTDPTTRAFHRIWWRERNRFHLDDERLQKLTVGRYLSFDTAMKDKDSSDYSACAVGDLFDDYALGLREVWREKLIFPDLVDRIKDTALRYNRDGKLSGIIIEDTVAGTSAYQTLLNAGPDWMRPLLIPFQPKGQKRQRFQQAAVWCKLGMVWLPQPSPLAPWLHDFERELFALPDTEHDDQGDAFAQLIIYLEHYLSAGWHARGTNHGVAA